MDQDTLRKNEFWMNKDKRILRAQCINLAHDYCLHKGTNITESDVLERAVLYYSVFSKWVLEG